MEVVKVVVVKVVKVVVATVVEMGAVGSMCGGGRRRGRG